MSMERATVKRTTIRLNEHLLVEVKQLAASSGTTFTALVEEALRELLARRGGDAELPPPRLVTSDGRGLREGVDLDNSAALLDLMERSD